MEDWSVSDEFSALLDDEKAWEEIPDPMGGLDLIESLKQKRKRAAPKLIPYSLFGKVSPALEKDKAQHKKEEGHEDCLGDGGSRGL